MKRSGFARKPYTRQPTPKLTPVVVPENVRKAVYGDECSPVAKDGAVASKAVRRAARGEECTVQIYGLCNRSPETTVLAHLPSEIAGTKATDVSSCFACSDCHSAIDRRVIDSEFELARDWYLRRAQVRTLHRLLDMGIITIKGHAA